MMPAFTANILPPPQPRQHIARRFAARWRLWRQKRRWAGEVANAAALGRLDGVLDDVGLTRAELDFLIDAPADSGRQFEELAEMEGVDLCALPASALREAVWNCIRCPLRAPCKRWLHTGLWDGDGDSRCPNAALLRH